MKQHIVVPSDTSGPPECTGNARACRLCDIIRQIFEGFPKEVDPGCEIGGSATEKASQS